MLGRVCGFACALGRSQILGTALEHSNKIRGATLGTFRTWKYVDSLLTLSESHQIESSGFGVREHLGASCKHLCGHLEGQHAQKDITEIQFRAQFVAQLSTKFDLAECSVGSLGLIFVPFGSLLVTWDGPWDHPGQQKAHLGPRWHTFAARHQKQPKRSLFGDLF